MGRPGLRKGDIVTHVNDAEWNGTAEILQDYIYECHAKHYGDVHLFANPEGNDATKSTGTTGTATTAAKGETTSKRSPKFDMIYS